MLRPADLTRHGPRMRVRTGLLRLLLVLRALARTARWQPLEVLVIIADGHVLGFLQLLLVLRNQGSVDLDLGSLGELTNKLQVALVREAAREPQERLLEIVVAPRAEVVVLEVPLTMELDVLGLHLPILDVYLVAHQNNRNVLAHAHDVAVPVRDVLVSDPRSNIEHDDGALALDVVPIAQATELLLSSRVPHVELQRPTVRGESERVHLHAQSRDVLLLELTCQVALHERRLANASIADQDELELRNCHILQRQRSQRPHWSAQKD